MNRTQRFGILLVVAGVAAALMIRRCCAGRHPAAARSAGEGRSFTALKKDLTETDAALRARFCPRRCC